MIYVKCELYYPKVKLYLYIDKNIENYFEAILINTKNKYLDDLPQNKTLCVFNDDNLIFSSSGKWLIPLFELEEFLKTYKGEKNNLSAHDTAIGKAAAVLMVRMGILRIHANLASILSKNFIEDVNKNKDKKIIFSYATIVERLLCATEDELAEKTDINEMYFLLRKRSRRVQGVSVEINNLSYKFGAINNFNLTLSPGDRLIITGENGSGKTTLLRLIAGIYKTNPKSILIDDKPISVLKKFTIGYIPQQTDSMQFSLSVEEVLSIALPSSVKNKAEVISNALIRTSSAHLKNRSYSSLSGGEKQKVSMARCLAQNARLLLLDEPTAALDSENRNMVIEILQSLTVTEIPTIIIVTHDKVLSDLPGWKKLKLEGNNL